MTSVSILGSGTPTPTASRFGSSFVVQTSGQGLMFDCGPAATHKLVKAGLFPTDIDRLFFTHHHFDHNADFPCLALCRWDQSLNDTLPLEVYGPRNTSLISQRLFSEEEGAFFFDWNARVQHPLSQQIFVNRGGVLPRPRMQVIAHDIVPGPVAEGDGWQVNSAVAEHVQPYLDSLAYRIDSPTASLVFTGDTSPCRSVSDLARGADIMFSMCWDHQASMDECGESFGQTGTLGAAIMAANAGVSKLVLVHSGPNLENTQATESALTDIAAVFKGEVLMAEELMTIDI